MDTQTRNEMTAYWQTLGSVVAPDACITASVLLEEVKRTDRGTGKAPGRRMRACWRQRTGLASGIPFSAGTIFFWPIGKA